MDRKEQKKKFDDFYQKTYPDTMARVLAKTGDFLNAEDLLADAYYPVYKLFLKEKKGELKAPERSLQEALKKVLAKYYVKHRKDLQVEDAEDSRSLEQLLSCDLELDQEEARRQMLSQDILEYVSYEPLPLRRAFTLYVYFNRSVEEIAAELKVSPSQAERYLAAVLGAVKDEYLQEYQA